MTALVFGLRMANVDPNSALFKIINSDDDYANYRALWDRRPGIPFLIPHIKMIRSAKDERKADEFLKSLREQQGLKAYFKWFICF